LGEDDLIRYYLGAIGLAFFASSAVAAPEDDYVAYKTAAEINNACGGLKYLEHQRTLAAAYAAVNRTPQFHTLNDGRMSDAEYNAWFATLDAKVAEQVQAVGCTQQAMPFIMQGRGVASESIYQGLVLAMHFSSLPTTDIMGHVDIEPDRMGAVQRYDGYLQALYRENYAAFAARQKELAAQALPAANPFGGDSMGFGALMTSTEDLNKISSAQSIAASAVDDVFFEVAAETAGFIVRPVSIQKSWTTPELKVATTVEQPGYVVVDGPAYDLIDLTPDDGDPMQAKLYRVLTLKPDGGLRAMFYGDAAARVAQGTARLYIRNTPLPAGATAYQFFASPEFRDGATGYDGVAVTSGCLSAGCFDFPAEATDAFVADPGNAYAELFVSPHPGAQPEVLDDSPSYKAGRVSNFYAHKLLRE
jgi:hypothetical protein